MILVTCLTICVKLGPDFQITKWNFTPYNYFKLEELSILRNFDHPYNNSTLEVGGMQEFDMLDSKYVFDRVIAAIYTSGVISICLFFLMKKFNVATVWPSYDDDGDGDVSFIFNKSFYLRFFSQ